MLPCPHVTESLGATKGKCGLERAISHDHPPRILLVDDDAVFRQFYAKVLIRSGYKVDTAEDGEAGWKVLDAGRDEPDSYDLLITDQNMPNLSGYELIEKLRSAHMALPVILVSAAPPRNTERLQLAALLPKPISPTQLLTKVIEVLPPAHPGHFA
jgi:DNA-binding response OmpR family regulator